VSGIAGVPPKRDRFVSPGSSDLLGARASRPQVSAALSFPFAYPPCSFTGQGLAEIIERLAQAIESLGKRFRISTHTNAEMSRHFKETSRDNGRFIFLS
jgi:hypothetical protein